MELGGAWRVATADDTLRRHFPEPDLDDQGWETLDVPGHWRSAPAFADSDGPLFYRRRFETPPDESAVSATPASDAGGSDAGGSGAEASDIGERPDGRRAWLDFDGLFYQGDVWLDGSYLGDTEGYFAPHSFEITEALAARREHTVAVEVTCTRPGDVTAKRNLTGVFQHWDCIDPAWNPGGIWAPVHVEHTGPVRIAGLKVVCPEARPERAVLQLEADLDAADATTATVTTRVRRHGDAGIGGSQPAEVLVERVADETLASGRNRVRWRVTIDGPDLWWPHALGDQPLHDVIVGVSLAGVASDEKTVVTGLRQVRMRNFVASINGERLFLKGANAGPVRRELAEASPAECEADVAWARDAGLDLIRLHAHISRPETYDAADRAGMLIWQDLPLQWGYTNVRRQAVRQARQAVRLLGHHPSIALWCGHNEPFALPGAGESDAGRATTRRFLAGQFLPGFNRTVLDSSLHRALERADSSRPVVSHSGVLPHPTGGTDTHFYAGWHHGEERDLPQWLARLPVLARFVGEFGAQAVPDSAGWMDPQDWPDLDWDRLEAAHGMDRQIFEARIPPADHATFEGWRRASQRYQADLIRHHIETLRRLKYRPTGGFCQFMLADAQPAVSASVLDHERRPKAGYLAMTQACAPVIVVADRPAATYRAGERVRLAVHAVSDLRRPLAAARATAALAWPGGQRTWEFEGDIAADSCTRIGRIDATFPDAAGPIHLELEMTWLNPDDTAGRAINHYQSELRP
jgi:beta-mannosidase